MSAVTIHAVPKGGETPGQRLVRLQAEARALARTLGLEAVQQASGAARSLEAASGYESLPQGVRDRMARLAAHIDAELLSITALQDRGTS